MSIDKMDTANNNKKTAWLEAFLEGAKISEGDLVPTSQFIGNENGDEDKKGVDLINMLSSEDNDLLIKWRKSLRVLDSKSIIGKIAGIIERKEKFELSRITPFLTTVVLNIDNGVGLIASLTMNSSDAYDLEELYQRVLFKKGKLTHFDFFSIMTQRDIQKNSDMMKFLFNILKKHEFIASIIPNVLPSEFST